MSLLKPPVGVRPEALVRARRGRALAPRAEDALFRVADILAEGRADAGVFYGSTLLTFDLGAVAPGLARDDAEAARDELFRAMEGSVRVRLRAMRLALADVARRVPDASIGCANVETRFRREGARVHVDVDLEVPFSLPSERLGLP